MSKRHPRTTSFGSSGFTYGLRSIGAACPSRSLIIPSPAKHSCVPRHFRRDGPVGRLPVGRLPVGRLPVGRLPVGRLPVGRLLRRGRPPRFSDAPPGDAPTGRRATGTSLRGGRERMRDHATGLGVSRSKSSPSPCSIPNADFHTRALLPPISCSGLRM